MSSQAVACFRDPNVKGDVLFTQKQGGIGGIEINALFTKLPKGEHGFHIHRAGDLRGEGCAGACEHYHRGQPSNHGGTPGSYPRHTGDLGNIVSDTPYTFFLKKVTLSDLLGRSVIVHADPDDLGLGSEKDSLITGHSGARIGCALIGRVTCSESRKTRKIKHH